MEALINIDILRRPTNWLVIGTMLLMGLFALHFALKLIHGSPYAPREKHNSRFS
jgi:hypothetical protein